ncbi:hypothetical protein TUST1-10_01120 [Vibrio phage ICP1_2004_A]|nr:hypothetical protein TUST1-191_01130 [Vibrio phage ICP1_2006_D]ADX88499.1 hypothetical protein TUST1-182_01130 [Vibrio phage ICP1_2006_C]ADX89636.1 hypothetical protein TUST1-10_01120 [Vibrio phage ICP1_2004_A]
MDTFKGFKKYEWLTFVTFLISSMVALLEGEFYYSFIILLGCVWIFTSAGYRHDVDILLENGEEIENERIKLI